MGCGHENRDHHNENGKRAECCAIDFNKAPERAFGRTRDRVRPLVQGFERGGHDGDSGRWPGEAGIAIPCGWASRSM